MTTTCITGATAGIGQAFAELLAGEGHDLVLVARDAERLDRLARHLELHHHVRVEVIPADLATPLGCTDATRRLVDSSRPVSVLVNNAGFSLNQNFVGGDLTREEYLLDVLVRAPLRLTHAVVPHMVGRGEGTIINVSSVVGWVPLGTYSAAKAWVTTFTEGLAAQLAGTGVTATALCPGLTRTEFHDRAGLALPRAPAWAWLDATTVARAGWRDAQAGRVISVPTHRYRWVSLAIRSAPRTLLRRASARRAAGRTHGSAPGRSQGHLEEGVGQ